MELTLESDIHATNKNPYVLSVKVKKSIFKGMSYIHNMIALEWHAIPR